MFKFDFGVPKLMPVNDLDHFAVSHKFQMELRSHHDSKLLLVSAAD